MNSSLRGGARPIPNQPTLNRYREPGTGADAPASAMAATSDSTVASFFSGGGDSLSNTSISAGISGACNWLSVAGN